MQKSKWFVTFGARPIPALRLFAFPYSGGTAGSYAQWREHLPEDVELVGVQLPGRANRFGEPLITNMDRLIDALLPELAPCLDEPFALFGHSNGALIALGVLDRLLREGLPAPLGIVLTGVASPTWLPREILSDLSDSEVRQKIARLGGTPPELLENEEFMKLALPVIRADFALGDSFSPAPLHPDVAGTTALVLAGTDDETSVESVFEWRNIFTASCSTASFGGDHFFIHSNPEALISVSEFLLSLRPAKTMNSLPRHAGA